MINVISYSCILTKALQNINAARVDYENGNKNRGKSSVYLASYQYVSSRVFYSDNVTSSY